MRYTATEETARGIDSDPIASEGMTSGYRQMLLVLLIIYALNFFDRQIINILAEPIKHELGLADWQIGAVSGLAFALFYTAVGIPIARLAERYNRPYIIAGSLTCWSGFTAICGLAQGFAGLFGARVGVGVGEAGCTPAAHSLIVDTVPRRKLASSLATYHLGIPLGLLFGLAAGGWMSDALGWRLAFVLAGVPGLIMAAIAVIVLREPRRSSLLLVTERSSFAETLRFLAKRPTFWFMSLASASMTFISFGRLQFMPSYFFRAHDEALAVLAAGYGLKSAGFLGIALGLCVGIAGLIGTFSGGKIADHFGERDARALGAVPAIAALISVPIFVGAMLVASIPLALGLIFVSFTFTMVWAGPMHAAVLSVTPSHMRATTSALSMLIQSLIGIGLGPLTVGLMSDGLAQSGGLGPAEGVRWALILSSIVGVLAAWFFWRASTAVERDLHRPG